MMGLKIKKKMANEIRKILLKKSLINLDYKIKRENDYVIIPLIMKPEIEILVEYELNETEIIDTDFEKQKKEPRSFKSHLKGRIEDSKIKEIKGSFDIIGEIVILEIPEDLSEFKNLIGDSALKFTKRKAVYRKKSEVKGIIRIRELEHIAGEKISETIHQEFGCKLILDVKKVYFSPRLATERKRVADQVKDNEIIVDMFSGIAPFPILIAKDHNVKIYAIDINPDAYYYAKKNIDLNKVKDRVILVLGDVNDVLKNEDIKANRIIMNLPGTAYKYLDLAFDTIKNGGIIHYYEFSEDFENPILRLKKAAIPYKVEILSKRKVRSKSPGIWHIGIDAKVTK